MDFNNEKLFTDYSSQLMPGVQNISSNSFLNNYENSQLTSYYLNENEINDSSLLNIQNNHYDQELVNSNNSPHNHQQFHFQTSDQITKPKSFFQNNSEMNKLNEKNNSFIYSNSSNNNCANNNENNLTNKFYINISSDESSQMIKEKINNQISYDNSTIISNNVNNSIVLNVSKIKNYSNQNDTLTLEKFLEKEKNDLNQINIEDNQYLKSSFNNKPSCSLINNSESLLESNDLNSIVCTISKDDLEQKKVLNDNDLKNNQCSDFDNIKSVYKEKDQLLNHNNISKKKLIVTKQPNTQVISSFKIPRKAQTKTIIIFKVIDQILLDGKVIKETVVSNQEIEKETGLIDWIENKKSSKLNKIKKNIKKNNLKRSVKDLNINLSKNSKETITNKKSKTEKTETKLNNELTSVLCKNQIKNQVQNHNNLINKSPELLKNSINKNSQLCSSILNFEFEEPRFKPIKIKEKVLAKWTDKNFYSGIAVKKETDNRWKIEFDDGGHRVVRENEIISIDYLPNGQSVMVNYLDGYCAKGTVKSRRLDTSSQKIFYLIEYIVGIKCMQSEYCSKDVFLNWKDAVFLLKKCKKNLNESKFADVDLNDIIPKGARIANKSITSSNLNYSISLEDLKDSALIDNLSSSSSTYSTKSDITNNEKKIKSPKKKLKNVKNSQLNEFKNINDINNSQKIIQNSIVLKVKE